jgi:hypothetical protein
MSTREHTALAPPGRASAASEVPPAHPPHPHPHVPHPPARRTARRLESAPPGSIP